MISVRYDLDFEIVALLLMSAIALHYRLMNQIPTRKGKAFSIAIVSCIVCSVFNLISSVSLTNKEFVPQWGNELLTFVFFVLEGISTFAIFRYILLMFNFDPKKENTIQIIGFVPLILFELLVIATPFIGVLYYFIDNTYYLGFGVECEYFYQAFYMLLFLVLLVQNRKKLDRRISSVVITYSFISMILILSQFIWKDVLLKGLFNASVIVLFYSTLQNPGELLDFSTETGNQRALNICLQQLTEEKNTKATVISFNIKNFQNVTNAVGMMNSAGLLKQIGKYLASQAGKWQVFHVTGGIFTLVIKSPEKAEKVIENIKERFANEWMINNNCVVVDIRMIVQHYPKNFKTLNEFFTIREYMIGRIPNDDKNVSILEADDKIVEQYQHRNKVEIALQRAIQKKSLEVYYQPIYSLEEKRIVSLEALIRMNDEEYGFISPEEFIPLAEKNGTIITIGNYVLEECCKFLSKHVLSNVSLGIRSVQINMSVVQCMQHDLKEHILPVLKKYHIPPSMITLEITEGLAIDAPALLHQHMDELGALGIAFAVDDYGSGHSNCSYLVKFPFKEVKIDKEMTWAYFSNETARIILENEIKTMKKLGIPLVVEGIEKIEQSEEMERLGVEYIQGYYYGKPLPESECLRYIRNFNSLPEEYGR